MHWLILKDAGQLVLAFSTIWSGKIAKIWSVNLEFRLRSVVWGNTRDFIVLHTFRNQLHNSNSCTTHMCNLFSSEGVLFCKDILYLCTTCKQCTGRPYCWGKKKKKSKYIVI